MLQSEAIKKVIIILFTYNRCYFIFLLLNIYSFSINDKFAILVKYLYLKEWELI